MITQNQAFAHPLSSEHLVSHSFTAQLCFTPSFSLVQFSCVPKSLPPPHPCFSVEGAYGKKKVTEYLLLEETKARLCITDN